MKEFINSQFYVDDGLGSASDPQTAIQILQEAKNVPGSFNIHLHKIASNNSTVLSAFPREEVAMDLLDVTQGMDPFHQTLGISWNTSTDNFVIQVDVLNKPFTRRAILSLINSIYGPLGFVSPIILTGWLLQLGPHAPFVGPSVSSQKLG